MQGWQMGDPRLEAAEESGTVAQGSSCAGGEK